jgi:lambda repressor-like predicted transcriptional regulator
MCEECIDEWRALNPTEPPRRGRPRRTPGKSRPESLPVEPFRLRALELHEAGASWEELARRAGYDARQLKRMLGLVRSKKNKESRQVPGAIYRYRYTQRNVMPETAKRLAEAFGMDPVEAGY